MKGSLLSSLCFLCKNPEATKVIVAGGFLVSVYNVPGIIMVKELQAQEWGDNMSEYASLANIGQSVLGILCSIYIGRVGDKLGQRFALLVSGFAISLPTYSLLAFGLDDMGLIAYTSAFVIAGMSGMTLTGCPALYAMFNQVVSPEDRELGFGIAFSFTMLIVLVMATLGSLVVAFVPSFPRAGPAFCTLLSVLFYVMTALVRLPPQKQDAPCPTKVSCPTEANGSGDDAKAEAEEDSSDTGSQLVVLGRCLAVSSVLDPLRFVFGHRSLRSLCIICSLVSMAETTLWDVMVQFAYGALNILEGDHEHEQLLVSNLICQSSLISMVFALLLVGILADRFDALLLVKWLIPISAILLCLPPLLIIWPEYWFTALSGIAVLFPVCIFPPLTTLVTQISPIDHVGEALGALASFKNISTLMGNVIVVAIVPPLQATGVENILWVLYPLSAALALSALVFARHVEAPAKGESSTKDGKMDLSTKDAEGDVELSKV